MAFGYGFISGLLSAILGIVGLGLVLSAHFPEYLTQADLRPLYSSPFLRAAIHLTLVTSFLLGSISAVLRANKALALTGIGLTLGAALLGGSQAPLMVQNHGPARGSVWTSSFSTSSSTRPCSSRWSGCSRCEGTNQCFAGTGWWTSPTSSSTRSSSRS